MAAPPVAARSSNTVHRIQAAAQHARRAVAVLASKRVLSAETRGWLPFSSSGRRWHGVWPVAPSTMDDCTHGGLAIPADGRTQRRIHGWHRWLLAPDSSPLRTLRWPVVLRRGIISARIGTQKRGSLAAATMLHQARRGSRVRMAMLPMIATLAAADFRLFTMIRL